MKQTLKYGLLILALLFVGSTLLAQDSITVSVKATRKVFAAAAESKVIQERLDTCSSAVGILSGQVSDLKEQIGTYKASSSQQRQIITLLERKNSNQEQQKNILLKDNADLQKKVKRQRKKNIVTSVLLIAGGIAATIIIN